MEIKLKPGSRPVQGKVKPLNPDQVMSLWAQLDVWLRAKVIRCSNFAWGAALVAALKKNGKIRWCANFSGINYASLSDSYPLPCIDVNLQKVQSAKFFSSLDSTGAYHTVKMHPNSISKTAFICSEGLFEFLRMLFGLKDAPAVYAMLVKLALSNCSLLFG